MTEMAEQQQQMSDRSSARPMLQQDAPLRQQMDTTPAHVITAMCGVVPSIVPTGSIGVVQDMGKFVGIQEPGCALYCPCIREISTISLAVQQMTCHSDCKTKDNVTVSVVTAVQYRVQKNMVEHAMFDIQDPKAQMHAFVDNVLRSFLPTLDLDDAYAAKDDIVKHIYESVSQSMGAYGYQILNVLITDLRPDASVIRAMNDINASRRQREADIERGEAAKTLKVKSSEADAEAMHLAGQGMARMRKAVADGFKESMVSMERSGISSHEAMHLMMTTQYLDTLTGFANQNASIMLPHGPGAVADIAAQIKQGFEQTAGPSVPVGQRVAGKKK